MHNPRDLLSSPLKNVEKFALSSCDSKTTRTDDPVLDLALAASDNDKAAKGATKNRHSCILRK